MWTATIAQVSAGATVPPVAGLEGVERTLLRDRAYRVVRDAIITGERARGRRARRRLRTRGARDQAMDDLRRYVTTAATRPRTMMTTTEMTSSTGASSESIVIQP